MIIWIASYPKSGNTWVRSLVSDYLYGDFQKPYSFDVLNKILLFPTRKQLSYLVNKNFGANNLSNDFLSLHWLNLQKNFCLRNLEIYKTHNAYHKNGTFFTDASVSKAAIYLIRDPRDIICSYSEWYDSDYNEYCSKLANPTILKNYCDDGEYPFTYIGSWGEHVNTWELASHHFPVLFIRYENLFNKTKDTFKNILEFLSNYVTVDIDDTRINLCIERSNLSALKKIEISKNFDENSGKKNFFNVGGSRYQKNLSPEMLSQIKNNFSILMEKYSYF